MGDQTRTFINLLGFESIESWEKFSSENREESIMIGAHFNIAIKAAIDKCKGVIGWRKIDLKKYNAVTKKRSPSPQPITKAVVKHAKLDNFSWSSILDQTDQKSSSSNTSTVSTSNESSTQTEINMIALETHNKEKTTMESIIQNLNFQIIHIQGLNGTYQYESMENQRRFKTLYIKFQDMYTQMGKALLETNSLIKKK
jgi:hypothetical protein